MEASSLSSDLSRDRKKTIIDLIERGLLPSDAKEVLEKLSTIMGDVRPAIHDRLQTTHEPLVASAAVASSLQETAKPEVRVLSPEQQKALLSALKTRFEAKENMKRHNGLEWSKVQEKLQANSEKMWSLNEMERTGGEPDVVGFDEKTNEFMFFDCPKESPEGRRNIVYDKAAEELLKMEFPNEKCNGNAVDMAAAMGIEILDTAQYKEILQKLGKFDLNSWSWLKTPQDVRKAGGALVGFRDEDDVGVYRDRASNLDGDGAYRGALRV
jgi:hypothetical protein